MHHLYNINVDLGFPSKKLKMKEVRREYDKHEEEKEVYKMPRELSHENIIEGKKYFKNDNYGYF